MQIDDLVTIALAAGDDIMAIYATDFDAGEKADGSAITAADDAAEKTILSRLAALYPDIPVLAEHFIDTISGEQGLPKREFTAEAMAALQTFNWPGNVRQLRNLLERLMILGGEGEEIHVDELTSDTGRSPDKPDATQLSAAQASLPLREARELFERDYLIAQINRFGGNISKTAAFVGMERSALHRKLKSLNVTTSNAGGARVAQVAQDEE